MLSSKRYFSWQISRLNPFSASKLPLCLHQFDSQLYPRYLVFFEIWFGAKIGLKCKTIVRPPLQQFQFFLMTEAKNQIDNLDQGVNPNNSMTIEPASFRYQNIVFPEIAHPLSFHSQAEFKDFLEKQAEKRGFKNTVKMFTIVRGSKYFRFACKFKFCPAKINFLKKNELYMLTTYNVNHRQHKIEPHRSALEKNVFSYYRNHSKMGQKLSELKPDIFDIFHVSSFQERYLRRKFETEQFNYEYFKEELKSREFDILEDWQEFPHDKFPRVIVLVSHQMRQLYKDYGDLVSYDIISGLLRNVTGDGDRYRIGVFSAFDSNMRLTIVGISIICDERKEDFCSVFEYFIRLHGRSPKTIITDQPNAMTLAINQLQSRQLYSGNHIYDPYYSLETFKKSLVGPNKEHLSQLFSQLIFTRETQQFREVIGQLGKIENLQENIASVERGFNSLSDVAYCEISRGFLGIGRFEYKTINEIIKNKIKKQTTMIFAMRNISRISHYIAKSCSKHCFKIFREPVENVCCDSRIREVRLSIENKPFERFLQNYFKSRSFKVTKMSSDELSNYFLVDDLLNNDRFQILDWTCICCEYEKTGICCPHLITAARITPKKSYLELIALRWKKSFSPIEQKQKVELIRKGFGVNTKKSIFQRKRKKAKKQQKKQKDLNIQ